jgi:mannitol operon transcriptional antiterminator
MYKLIMLLIERNDYVSYDVISSELEVSKRTIFRMMDDLIERCLEYKIEVKKASKKGIYLEGETIQKELLIDSFSEIEFEFDQNERRHQIQIQLLKLQEPQKLYYFADLLNVSEATISNDMDSLVEWFTDKKLMLMRKPGFGVNVEGSELRKRNAMIDLYYETLERQEKKKKNEFEYLLGMVTDETIYGVKKVIKKFEKQLNSKLVDYSKKALILHIVISVERIKVDERIVLNAELLDYLLNDEDVDLVKKIAHELEKHFGLYIPKEEIAHIMLLIKGSKLKNTDSADSNDYMVSNFELSHVALKIIKNFYQIAGYDFYNDEELLIGLVNHLRPALTRLKFHLTIRNPLLDRILDKYQVLFDQVKESTSFISDKYKFEIPDEEVGFLTMHFGAAVERQKRLDEKNRVVNVGVVCAGGIGTSSFLASRLLKTFKHIQIVGQFSLTEVMEKHDKLKNINLLVSSVDYESDFIKTIIVDPLLDENDIKRVAKEIELSKNEVKPSKQEVTKKKNFTKTLNALTSAVVELEKSFDLITLNKVPTINDLVTMISKKHGKSVEAQEEIEEKLLARDKIGSTIVHHLNLLLLHTTCSELKNIKFNVIRHPSFDMGNQKVKYTLVMLIPEHASKYQKEVMSYISKLLIDDQNFSQELLKGNKNQLSELLATYLDEWVERKIDLM